LSVPPQARRRQSGQKATSRNIDPLKRFYDKFGLNSLMWGRIGQSSRSCGYAKALALCRDELSFFIAVDRRRMVGSTALNLWLFA
jgi:hypothetical protein